VGEERNYSPLMPPVSLVKEAHKAIADLVQTDDIAIDATCGNGHDTLFLAEQVGVTGKVYGFDIQQRALDSTALKLKEQRQFSQVEVICAGHEDIEQYIQPHHQHCISAIMFNLGYLPGSDKSLITQTETTLPALKAACRLLKSSGLITIIAYPGHQGGLHELEMIQNWIGRLDNAVFQYKTLTLDKNDLSKPQLTTLKKL
jgi:ubiquinone/menaquinone biosynthesis C-methylase UbiE